jgi:hypothetical protein
MLRRSRLVVVCVIVALLGTAPLPGLGGMLSPAASVAVASEDGPVLVTLRISGIDLGSRARYAVTLQRPLDAAITNAHVSVQVPAGAELVEVAQPVGRASFDGRLGPSLTWTIAEVAAGEPAPVLSFSLASPATGVILASLTHDGAPEAVEAEFVGELARATATEAEVALPANGAFVTAGDTGVVLGVASGDGAGAMVRVRRLGADANPPDADLLGVWWCALVAIDGLPAGVTLSVVAPARQALAPDAPLLVFEQAAGAEWAALTDAATVTPDGQSISFFHSGGLRATGTTPRNQPVAQAAAAAATGADPAVISVTFSPATIASGTNTTLSAVIRNVGSVAAPSGTNVIFTLEMGMGVQAIPTQETGVVCAQSGPQLATCVLPALNPQASKTITLTVRGTNTGTAAIMPCVQVNLQPNVGSDNPANNELTGCLTVVPANSMQADLQVVSVAAAAASIDTAITPSGRTEVTAVIRNNGPAGSAAGTTVTFTLPAGITLNVQQPVQPAGVTCSGTGATRTCTLPTLAAGQTISPTIAIRGTTAGASRCVTVQVAPGANDPVAGNNSGQACVAVTDPPPAPLDLSIKLERTAGQPTVGGTVTYRVTAKVESGTSIGQILIAVVFVGDFDLVMLTTNGWNCGTGGSTASPSRFCGITNTVAAPNAFPVLEFQLRLRSCNQVNLDHQAVVNVAGDANAADNSSSLNEKAQCPKLTVTITQSDEILSAQFRDRQTWNISIKNTGGRATAGAVTVRFKAVGVPLTNWIQANVATPCSLDDPETAGLIGITVFGENPEEFGVTCTLSQPIQPGVTVALPAISARISLLVPIPVSRTLASCSAAFFDTLAGVRPTTTVEVTGGDAPDTSRELPFQVRECFVPV